MSITVLNQISGLQHLTNVKEAFQINTMEEMPEASTKTYLEHESTAIRVTCSPELKAEPTYNSADQSLLLLASTTQMAS